MNIQCVGNRIIANDICANKVGFHQRAVSDNNMIYHNNLIDNADQAYNDESETRFKICSGYVLSGMRSYLRRRGFKVEKVEITGDLQEMVERSYVSWCVEVGVPAERLVDRRRFWTLLVGCGAT